MRNLRIIYIGDFRKKILLILAVAAFWVLMFLAASYFVHSNHVMNADANLLVEYSSYESPEGKFSFKYPSAFTLTPRNFSGNDIQYHIDFSDREGAGYGFVQIWKMTMPVKDFLEKSKAASQLKYKYFYSRKMKVNGFTGYYWDYSVPGSNNTYYKGNEVFLEGKDQMYRISYFIPENQWNEGQKEIFTSMIKSFRKL